MTRLRAPMRREGVTTARWKKHRAWEKAAVMRRFLENGQKCEGCGKRLTQIPEWAHAMGRGTRSISEPFASLAELSFALCHQEPWTGPGCHEKFDRYLDVDLRLLLLQTALDRLAKRFKKSYPVDELLRPDDGIRRIIRELEEEDPLGRPDLSGTLA